jgi:hypothetical protein
MNNEIEQLHYNNGWNDTEHGIATWTPGCYKGSQGAYSGGRVEDWAANMKFIAQEQVAASGVNAQGKAYARGVIDCVTEFFNTGKVGRK